MREPRRLPAVWNCTARYRHNFTAHYCNIIVKLKISPIHFPSGYSAEIRISCRLSFCKVHQFVITTVNPVDEYIQIRKVVTFHCLYVSSFSELRNTGVRFEVFTAVTMKKSIFWDVTRCDCCKNRRF
jgi:hypothetical protein